MIILLVLYFFAVLPYQSVGKRIFCKLNQQSGAGTGAGRSRVFLAPWSRSRLKKNQEPEPEPEPLGKKIRSRSRSRLKKNQEPEPEPLKNLPAPQPSTPLGLKQRKTTIFGSQDVRDVLTQLAAIKTPARGLRILSNFRILVPQVGGTMYYVHTEEFLYN